jgi:hypothetical protein
VRGASETARWAEPRSAPKKLTAVSAIFLDLLFGFQRPIPTGKTKTGQVFSDPFVWGVLLIVTGLRLCQVLKYYDLLGFPATEAVANAPDRARDKAKLSIPRQAGENPLTDRFRFSPSGSWSASNPAATY